MNGRLSMRQVQSYREEGILFPIRVLDGVEISTFRTAFDDMEQYGGPQRYARDTHLFFSWAYQLATHSGVVEVVQEILGPEILVDGTLILTKYPADGSFAPWHQDGEYSGWYKTPSVSAWIALTDSHSRNGCMRVVQGSHLGGRHPHRKAIYEKSLFLRSTEIEVEVDETAATDVELKAGELSLHDSSIIHGSSPNQSNTRRIGFVVRFVTPAFQSRADQLPVVRASGTGDCGLLPLLAVPPTGELAECFARWRAALPLPSPAHAADRSATEETTAGHS
jgi:non-haem Fe2+, alpha-ketoglutarate-dependent halogenase